MSPKKIFKKSKNFEFFQKRGVKGVKKQFFCKNSTKIEKGFKNWILNMCHMSPKKIFKKSQNFESFQKRGFKGVKKWIFLKKDSKIGKGFKNWILNMSHTPQKENFVLTNFMTGDEGIHKLRYNLLKYPILEIHIHPWNQFLLGRLFIRRSSNLDKLKSSEKRQF